MDVTTTELKHSPGSLAGMTLDEGIPLKKVTLIERISESSRRERSGTQLLPSLLAAQKTGKVREADDSAGNQSLTVRQQECLERQQSSTASLRKVIRRHYKFVRRRRQEKRMLYKLKLRDKGKTHCTSEKGERRLESSMNKKDERRPESSMNKKEENRLEPCMRKKGVRKPG